MTIKRILFFAILISVTVFTYGQKDSARPQLIDSFILKHKGIIGDLARNLLADTLEEPGKFIERNDQLFQRYRGMFIRKIIIKSLDFGVSIGDTSKKLNNKLTNLLNHLHWDTRERVVRNNLFFHEGELLSPYLLGINESHLRDLIYLQDAKIRVQRVPLTADSVDVWVIIKDAFSLGGGLRIDRMDKFEMTAGEDNLYGLGDRLQVQGLYDGQRSANFGTGAEYIRRNFKGSFTDLYTGYKSYGRSFSNNKPEDMTLYAGFIKPLVHPLMKFTYAAEASMNTTENLYNGDSVYKANYAYKLGTFDAWIGWNLSHGAEVLKAGNHYNWLLSGRVLRHHFYSRPEDYLDKYFYHYIDFKGTLGAISVFSQDFYRTQYLYGFGRYEDVPTGEDASITAGWTKSNNRVRPYAGLDYKRYFFTRGDNYFNLVFKLGSYFYNAKIEDLSVLTAADYFSRLHQLSPKWKQRLFLNASVARQFNYVLTEPLLINNEYGIDGYNNDNTAGDARISLKGESVFFSPWTVLYFHLAPFVFGEGSVFNINEMGVKSTELYSAVGGGFRIQNESLVFGTIEIKAAWYPKPNFNNERWNIGFSTNVRFRYNKEFIKRPELVSLNSSQVHITRIR
jgi:hypothetical protein